MINLKGFNFRLQKLLDIRLDLEEQSKLRFKEAQIEKNNVEDKLQLLKSDYNKYSKIDYKQDAVFQKIKYNYIIALESTIDNTKEELRNKSRILEEKREELKNKQMERKTVEILKEKKLNQFVKEQNGIEQRNNDEFALYGFMRKKLEKGGEIGGEL